MSNSLNILGSKLEACCYNPLTGFYRDGYCHSNTHDIGRHLVCAQLTDSFLQYSLSQGNDLISAHPNIGFPGLKAGDAWCLCINRWLEAHNAGCAPMIYPNATHILTLKYVNLEILMRFAVKE